MSETRGTELMKGLAFGETRSEAELKDAIVDFLCRIEGPTPLVDVNRRFGTKAVRLGLSLQRVLSALESERRIGVRFNRRRKKTYLYDWATFDVFTQSMQMSGEVGFFNRVEDEFDPRPLRSGASRRRSTKA